MHQWELGKFVALVDDTEATALSLRGGNRASDEDSRMRAFNARVLSGRLRSAVRVLTNRAGGKGVLEPDEACTKTGRPVIDILRSKHPKMRDPAPDLEDPDRGSFEEYPSIPEPLPLEITDEVVSVVGSRLSGGAGPGGTDAVSLRNWLLRFGKESEALRLEFAKLAEWLANSHPPWAAYRGLMACRLVALDKDPGVRPIGIGEIYRRLLAKCLLKVAGAEATAAAGNLNLCAGLAAGIEGAVHAVREAWETPQGEPPNFAPEPQPGVEAPPLPSLPTDGMDEAEELPLPPLPDPTVCVLIDATNGFNELGRRAMLWSVRHLWPAGSRFAFNCYRHSAQLILRQSGQPCHVLSSDEGVTQGDPLAMVLYGLALVPLARRLRQAAPDVVQPWYADDFSMVGKSKAVARAMDLLVTLGPARGYYPEPTKSLLICHDGEQAEALTHLGRFHFASSNGHRYVGGFIGTPEARSAWLEPKIQAWIGGIDALARAARHFPQAAYAGLAKSLQSEWQYLQRVLPDCSAAFEPVEEALASAFLPALFQAEEPMLARQLLALPVKRAGLGIPNPAESADDCHEASKAVTRALTLSLLKGEDLVAQAHLEHASAERRLQHTARLQAADDTLSALKAAAPDRLARFRLQRAQETGAWLTTMPESLNGTELTEDEFRDSLRLRFGLCPTHLPDKCDGCGSAFTVEHGLSCRQGGLILLRHDDVAREWHHLCAQATQPSAVSDEPLIHTGRAAHDGEGALGTQANPDSRGDVAVHGFWKRGQTCVFDIRITDTEAKSYRSMDPAKVLARGEKEKKDKYLQACVDRRRSFTPLVFSIDGLRGKEGKGAQKRLAFLLSGKWKKTYSAVAGYVNSRLSVALVRATSLCLRGARDPTARAGLPSWDSGEGLALYR
jgi:hypothetical protein